MFFSSLFYILSVCVTLQVDSEADKKTPPSVCYQFVIYLIPLYYFLCSSFLRSLYIYIMLNDDKWFVREKKEQDKGKKLRIYGQGILTQ